MAALQGDARGMPDGNLRRPRRQRAETRIKPMARAGGKSERLSLWLIRKGKPRCFNITYTS